MAVGDTIISNTTIDEHLPAGTLVGYLSTEGGTGNETYTLEPYQMFVNGSLSSGWWETYRSTDYFQIVGNAVQTTRPFSFGTDISLALTNGTMFKVHVLDVVDRYEGTDGNDHFYTSKGDDIFIGQAGTDTAIDSGGIDTAIFSGNFAEYAFTRDQDMLNVHDTRAGGDGRDILNGFEYLQFADKTVSTTDLTLDTAPSAAVLSSTTLKENSGSNTVVGTLSATDPEGRALTFSLSDSRYFHIEGNQLIANDSFDFETAKSHSVRIGVTDAAQNTVWTDVSIAVQDVDDIFKGKGTADTAYGAQGRDKMYGEGGNDRLVGRAGADYLEGGKGNDALKGEEGNDTLYGGLGADRLYGGSGKDTFVFKTVKESTSAAAGRDTIFDFSVKQNDKMDLSAIDSNTKQAGNQAFAFIGEKDFSKKAGELRYDKKNFDTYIYGDVNGDGKADFAIHLDQATPVVKGFFFL